MMTLHLRWLEAKEAERAAIEKRRLIEDELVQQLRVNSAHEGSQSFDIDGYQVKVTCRIDRKVDADMVQELAAEHGLSEHLASLFRWKPELNMSAWKAADESITRPLAGAITAKPGRPSFTITKKD